jgi:hypothetical protein
LTLVTSSSIAAAFFLGSALQSHVLSAARTPRINLEVQISGCDDLCHDFNFLFLVPVPPLRGEVLLAMKDFAAADDDFAHACRMNPRAVDAWFLHGYIAWKRGDDHQASEKLGLARNARGSDWKPAGSVLEGDVQRRMYTESGFLKVFEQQWDGRPDPRGAYSSLDSYLRRLR